MTLPSFVREILAHLTSEGYQAFVVGGCVRNDLLGLTPDDWDICTSATPNEILETFKDYRTIKTGIQHGTITVLTKSGMAEITTFRRDGSYSDNRHPESVSFVSDVEQDLARRDFTINAMAYAPERGLIDPYNGKSDLEQRILRCVGKPQLRFREDALRILRALRFSAIYHLKIAPETARAIHSCRGGLSSIAGERIYTECKKMLTASAPGALLISYPDILSVLFETDAFCRLAGEQPDVWQTLMRYLDALPPTPELRLAALLHPLAKEASQYNAVFHRLRIDHKSKRRIAALLSRTEMEIPNSLPHTRYCIRELGLNEYREFLVWKTKQALFLPDTRKNAYQKRCDTAQKYLNLVEEQGLCCSYAELAITGGDLLAQGVPAGDRIGELLETALCAVIDEIVPNEKNALIDYLFAK